MHLKYTGRGKCEVCLTNPTAGRATAMPYSSLLRCCVPALHRNIVYFGQHYKRRGNINTKPAWDSLADIVLAVHLDIERFWNRPTWHANAIAVQFPLKQIRPYTLILYLTLETINCGHSTIHRLPPHATALVNRNNLPYSITISAW